MLIVINRPRVLNALNDAAYTELSEALEAAARDEHVLCAILAGAPESRYFCAGQDVNEVHSARLFPLDKLLRRPVVRFMRAAIDFPKPLLAAVHGPAVGIGFTMLLHCDAVYARAQAHFRLPFLDMGVVPEFCSSIYLEAALGGHRTLATEMLLMQRRVTAEQLAAAGHLFHRDTLFDTHDALWSAVEEGVARMVSVPFAERALPMYKDLMSGAADGRRRKHEVLEAELQRIAERAANGDVDRAPSRLRARLT